MTKRIGGMQPYFFPYLGYWQLIGAVDCFVLFDEAQYIKQSWINRNQILKYGGGWQYINVPVSKHPLKTPISDVLIAPVEDWQSRVIKKLDVYRFAARFFDETMELVHACLKVDAQCSIGELNAHIVRLVCEALSIRSEIVVSSKCGFDYARVTEPGDWALTHAIQLGATEIVNPINGVRLQNLRKLAEHGIGLSALHPPTDVYKQVGQDFEPSLSIIDVLMFNGVNMTRQLIERPRLSRSELSDLGAS